MDQTTVQRPPSQANGLSRGDLWTYGTGEGATSISVNGISAFAMLFYTQVIGMSPALAGIALSIATIYDAVTDPLMGSISDRTHSRFGRRHPYMLAGGLVMALAFMAMWFVPGSFREGAALFVYVLAVNIVLKTAFTVFVVPYTAFGFEICRNEQDRTRIQGVRYGFNMIVNVVFGACAWILFFGDEILPDGARFDGTKIESNYLTMGAVLTTSTVLLVVFCVVRTFKFSDKGQAPVSTESHDSLLKSLIHDLKDVYTDKLVWIVFGFFGIAQFSMMVVSQIQMFTYVEYMQFTATQKTFVHMGGMIGFMTGSFCLGSLVSRFDKRKTGYLAMIISSTGGLGLLAVFTGGLLDPLAKIGSLPVAVLVFGLLQLLWWGGCGILVPLATSMISDLSEVKRWQTGEITEGRYAAGFSFFLKAASSVGLIATGFILKASGYVSGADIQTADAVNKVALMTFATGPILMLGAFLILRKYPIDHAKLERLHQQYQARSDLNND